VVNSVDGRAEHTGNTERVGTNDASKVSTAVSAPDAWEGNALVDLKQLRLALRQRIEYLASVAESASVADARHERDRARPPELRCYADTMRVGADTKFRWHGMRVSQSRGLTQRCSWPRWVPGLGKARHNAIEAEPDRAEVMRRTDARRTKAILQRVLRRLIVVLVVEAVSIASSQVSDVVAASQAATDAYDATDAANPISGRAPHQRSMNDRIGQGSQSTKSRRSRFTPSETANEAGTNSTVKSADAATAASGGSAGLTGLDAAMQPFFTAPLGGATLDAGNRVAHDARSVIRSASSVLGTVLNTTPVPPRHYAVPPFSESRVRNAAPPSGISPTGNSPPVLNRSPIPVPSLDSTSALTSHRAPPTAASPHIQVLLAITSVLVVLILVDACWLIGRALGSRPRT